MRMRAELDTYYARELDCHLTSGAFSLASSVCRVLSVLLGGLFFPAQLETVAIVSTSRYSTRFPFEPASMYDPSRAFRFCRMRESPSPVMVSSIKRTAELDPEHTKYPQVK